MNFKIYRLISPLDFGGANRGRVCILISPFGGAHRGRVCVRVFIEVSEHACCGCLCYTV